MAAAKYQQGRDYCNLLWKVVVRCYDEKDPEMPPDAPSEVGAGVAYLRSFNEFLAEPTTECVV